MKNTKPIPGYEAELKKLYDLEFTKSVKDYELAEKRSNFIKLILSNYGLTKRVSVRTQEQVRNMTERHK